MNDLYDLKMMLCDELEQYGAKGDLSTGDLEVVDKNDEWTDLKVVLSGYDGRGDLKTAEQSFTKSYTTVSIDVSGNGMSKCTDCTLAIKNGEETLREFTGLYMTHISFDISSSRAMVPSSRAIHHWLSGSGIRPSVNTAASIISS